LSKGTLSESGAKIYVSAKGNVQMLDRLDLNGDGWLDIVLNNSADCQTSNLNSYIYWGSTGGKFSAANRSELPTLKAGGNSVADLNSDGYPDIIFSIRHDGTSYKTNSLIYWGSYGGGYSTSKRTELPTLGTQENAVADLNGDGYLDIVFSNEVGNSYIYWGSSGNFLGSKPAGLPTIRAQGVSIADLDRDGHLDLVFSNLHNGATYTLNSYIYWGSAGGNFSAGNRSLLPTVGAKENSVADLDNDGHLDVIFSNYHDNLKNTFMLSSYVYWGSIGGKFSVNNREKLPTQGALGNSVADLNNDGHLDIVFSSAQNDNSYNVNSFAYFGASGGKFTTKNRQDFPTHGAHGNLVADFNGDGNLDVVFSNWSDLKTYTLNSFIYWGAPTGYSSTNLLGLPTLCAKQFTTTDPGSVYDRKPVQTFTSRILDTGSGAVTYKLLSWKATVPKNTSLKLQVRSAASPVGLQSAKWHGPTSTTDSYIASTTKTSATINTVHKGDRFIQYRATFSHDFGSTPVLDRVEITYSP